jgi:hypothetical protein
MKINSRKLLVFSYALSGKPILYTHLEYLWPEITAGGRRGLVAYLQKQRLITIDYVSKQAQISISAIGRAWVEEEYFSEKKEHSHQGSIVLLYPGVLTTEPKVRQLKALLRQELIELGPRTFFSQSPLSEALISQLRRRFFSLVAVMSIGNWQMGDPNTFINYYLQKNSESNLISGVSSQITELIEKKITFSSASDQSKLQIFSLLDRLFEIIEFKQHHPTQSNNTLKPGRELLALFSSLF